jgi:hypothetical protein
MFSIFNTLKMQGSRPEGQRFSPDTARYSPGGLVLQDYHWSGGLYSNKFQRSDKWGFSEPQQVYGPPEPPAGPSLIVYPSELTHSYPQPFTNTQLLQTPPNVEADIHQYPFSVNQAPQRQPLQPSNIEKFTDPAINVASMASKLLTSNNANATLPLSTVIIIQVLVYLLFLVFHMAFSTPISQLPIWIKIAILIVILSLIIYLLTKSSVSISIN